MSFDKVSHQRPNAQGTAHALWQSAMLAKSTIKIQLHKGPLAKTAIKDQLHEGEHAPFGKVSPQRPTA
jgi:hypothetical protein